MVCSILAHVSGLSDESESDKTHKAQLLLQIERHLAVRTFVSLWRKLF